MLRGLLLLVTCLVAGLPTDLCLCDHHAEAAEHSDHDAPPPDECACELHPREATVPPTPVGAGHVELSVALPVAVNPALPPPVPYPAFRSESPPGGAFLSLPLYLSVGRLLI